MPLTLNIQSFARPDAASVIKRISTAPDGTQPNGNSYDATLSPDGRYALFDSDATNLIAGDTNGKQDIFRKDLITGEVVRLSTANGAQADGDNFKAQFSPDGRYVLFESFANNLVRNDSNTGIDLLRKDLATGEIVCVSTTAQGTQQRGSSMDASFSADGRSIVFTSFAQLVSDDIDRVQDIYRKDLVTGAVERLSTATDGTPANDGSYGPGLSPDGRYALFYSKATNLVEGDTNGKYDIFLRDLTTGAMERISAAASNIQANGDSYYLGISPDGRYVLFMSDASNLVAGDTNGATDIFRKDLLMGGVERISTAADGTQGNDGSYGATLSPDGRYVLFMSDATNLVAGDTNGVQDVFRKDLVTGEVVRLSTAANGAQADEHSYDAKFGPDGRSVVFTGDSDKLVGGDSNGMRDVFLVDTTLLADRAAVVEGRFVELKLGVGAAASVSLAWGDGATSTVTPTGGSATFAHAYASSGTKAAVATVHEKGVSWAVPYLIDLASGTMNRNTAAAAHLTGSKGKDRLAGDDLSDRLSGGYGNDALWGGKGKDVFVFDGKLGSSKTDRKVNFDTIKDFSVKDDSIWLDNALFKKNKTLFKAIKKGTEKKPTKLAKKFFALDEAKDGNDYFVYDTKKRVLSYDADGSGSKAAIEIATFTKNKALKNFSHKDLFFI